MEDKDRKPLISPEDANRLGRERIEGLRGALYSSDVRGYSLEETLRTTENPNEVWAATLEAIKNFHSYDMVPEEQRYYEPDRVLNVLQNRAFALSLSREELQKRGKVIFHDDDTVNIKEKGYELGRRTVTVERPVRIEKDRAGTVVRTLVRPTEIDIPYFGTNEERKEMFKVFKNSYELMQIYINQISHQRIYRGNIENLTGLVEDMYLGGQMSGEAFGKILNTPGTTDSPKETITRSKYKENVEIGQMVWRTWFLYKLIGSCEKKDEFLALRNTPGYFKFLFPESTPDKISNMEDLFIGNPSTWTSKETHTANSYKNPREKRGSLTKYGNIFAHFSGSDYESVRKAVRVFLGGGDKQEFGFPVEVNTTSEIVKFWEENPDVKFAEDFGLCFFKYWGEASEVGTEIYNFNPREKNDHKIVAFAKRLEGTPGQGKVVITEMGADTTDDYVKLRPYLFMRDYWQKGRDAGPIKIIFNPDYEIPLVTGFMEGIVFKISDKKERSFIEMLTGAYSGRTSNIQEIPMDPTDLDCISLGRRAFQKFALQYFMGGRGGDSPGIFHLLQKTNLRLESATDENWWLDVNKKIQLSAGVDAVVINGKYRTHDEDDIATKKENASVKILTALVENIESYTQHAPETSTAGGRTGILSPSLVNKINHALNRFNERTGLKIRLVKLSRGEEPETTKRLFEGKQ